MAYQSSTNFTGQKRAVTYLNDSTFEFLDLFSKERNIKRSKAMKSMINEHKLCIDLTGRTVWQVIQDNIKLRKELKEHKQALKWQELKK